MLPAMVQASWLDRVGGVKKAFEADLLADRQIGDTGLDPHGAVLETDVQHPVHLGDTEDDGVLLRDGAAGQRGPGAARHDLDPVLLAEAEHGRDLLRR